MNKIFSIPMLVLGLSVPAIAAGDFVVPAKEFGTLSAEAAAVGEDSRDQALAALYNRLFQLQDLRRGEFIGIDGAGLTIGDLHKRYRKLDRRMSREDLEEIAVDAEHRRYPRLTETAKRNLMEEAAKHLRLREIARIKLKRIDADIAFVEKLIERHLESRRAG